MEVDEKEPSGIEYARTYGLCVDYTTERLRVGNVNVPSDIGFYQDLRDPPEVFITNALEELTKERLAINKDAVLLLKGVYSFQEPPATDLLAIDGRKQILGLKHELPVLQSDYQLDLLNFGSAAMPNLRNLRIPFEATNEESDESFEWPAKYFAYIAQCEEKVKAEKITVSRGALVYLQDAIRDEYVAEDSETVKAESLIYKPTTAVLPLTPPLLPLSPPLTPYIPSSPANRLPRVPDSSDSFARETITLENQIMAADSLVRKSSDSSDSMLLDVTHPPQFSPLVEDQMSSNLKHTTEDLKVEGPLTPSMFSSSPMRKLKSVSFSETLLEFIPYPPWAGDSSEDDSNASIDFDKLFRDIEPLAKQAKRKIENEQLSGADTTARVDVPDLDFTLPMAPWNEYSLKKGDRHKHSSTELDAQMKFLLRSKREDLKTTTSWHGLSALERDLQWGIFTTRISSVNLDEKIHGETELNKMLIELTRCDIATSSAQVWKRDGLRLLDDDEDEEELELAGKEERMDVEALVQKRKLEMDDEVAETTRKRSAPQGVRTPHSQSPLNARSKTFKCHQQRTPAPASRKKARQSPTDTGNELMFGGFSATTALHKFMETRGKPPEPVYNGTRKQTLTTHNSIRGTRASRILSREPPSDPPVIGGQLAQTKVQVAKPKGEQLLRLLPDLPTIPGSLAPCSFIVSSSLLQQRSLMKQVEQLYPGAEFLYRDYNLPHSAFKEADILLSPSSGLLFTTLQQVKQRALPGQPDHSPVKELMTVLQLRYERLVVMVSEGLSREMEALGSSRPDDPRDKDAMLTFESFASQLEGEVLVKYVHGGEQAFAHSIVVEMANYGLPHGSVDIGDIKPLAVETSWEVFLRRVGLNPFAAQVLVASLKQPFDVQLPTSSGFLSSSKYPRAVSVSGMPAFLMMDEEERVKYFQALMGGSRILRRVSMVLDQEWVSAAHGFRM
ncbi:uncharacterized protein K460DRAFT_284342 [Cucurbitaria berberidis CBS 394.84]|uniref:Uncharacterized protein n=1 Tax=Cucurbitaria berberidis CBS 394.84 TaxID=1168544 RepID=A0A9P4GJY8_9PLEO|nr:uncharacterized protein K460DRAFT_284342 [Cucurbitaria berberidis CBS 394.84]KAF1846657.1 hypothetical protein K460DRAFT_284342 [Cucurbitaria berberidis CBS 394.84]